MGLYTRMAWRNIWRHRRRSTITITGLALAVALLIFFIAMYTYWMKQMEENVIGLSLGSLQIHHPLYLADQNLYQVVEGADRLLAELRAQGYAATARVYGYGLLQSDRTGRSAGVWLKGISPQDEPRVTDLHQERCLAEGHYLSGRTRTLTLPAEPLPAEVATAFADPLGGEEEEALGVGSTVLEIGEMVVGNKLATTLRVGPGDTVAVVTMAADGTIGNEVFDVAGVFKSFSEVEDRSLALVTHDDYQRLFRLPAGQVHEIAVRIPQRETLAAAKAKIAGIVGAAGETRSWREIVPAVAEMVDLSATVIPLFLLIMYAGAGLLIMNALLMMVFEHIREFGVLKALGFKGRQLIVLVYCETFWMCVIAAILGTAAGSLITLWVGAVGVDLRAIAPEGFVLSGSVLEPVMYAEMTADALVLPVVMLFVIAFLSVLYPAIKAAVLEPVQAIYHV